MPEKTPDEFSQVIQTQRVVEEVLQGQKTDWNQTIATILTLIAMAVGAVLWASNAHAEIRDWTAEQDFVTKSELKEVIKEQYVKKEDFVVVKEKLTALQSNHEKVLETLEKMDSKLDRLENKVGATAYSNRRTGR